MHKNQDVADKNQALTLIRQDVTDRIIYLYQRDLYTKQRDLSHQGQTNIALAIEYRLIRTYI